MKRGKTERTAHLITYLYLIVADEKKGGIRWLPIAIFYYTLYFALGFFFFDRLPFIIGLLALGKADQYLGFSSQKIYLERNECESFLGDLVDELPDFLAMEQELSRAERLVVHDVAVGIRADIGVEEIYFILLHDGIAVRQVREAQAQGLHLRALEHEPRLERLLDKIIVTSLAVRGDCGVFFFLGHMAMIHDTRCRMQDDSGSSRTQP
jgi:hypothetical protein